MPADTHEIVSPELALIDPVLGEHLRSDLCVCVMESPPAEVAPLSDEHEEVRRAARRLCELGDVTPPARRARPLLLRFGGIGVLWIEAGVLALMRIGIH